jgi:hypothetical protein
MTGWYPQSKADTARISQYRVAYLLRAVINVVHANADHLFARGDGSKHFDVLALHYDLLGFHRSKGGHDFLS